MTKSMHGKICNDLRLIFRRFGHSKIKKLNGTPRLSITIHAYVLNVRFAKTNLKTAFSSYRLGNGGMEWHETTRK